MCLSHPIIVNREAALERLGGDEELFLEVLDAFVQNFPLQIDELHAGIREDDRKLIQRIAHSIKSASASIGGGEISKVANVLESAALDQKLKFLQGQLEELESEFQRFTKFVHEQNWGSASNTRSS